MHFNFLNILFLNIVLLLSQFKILIGKHDVNTPYLLIVSNYNFYNDNNFLLKVDGMKSNKINIIF